MGILPIGTKSGADAVAGQDKAVQDEPPRDDQYKNQPFIQEVSPFARVSFFCQPLRMQPAAGGRDENGDQE
jgi:hypothetical protein